MTGSGSQPREALILCGGLGTRLQAVVSDRPKPLADVGGRPFLDFLVSWAARQGLTRIVLSIGYKAELIRESFAKPRQALEVLFCEEKTPLGTGGALALALPMLSQEPVLVMNGDTFCDVRLADFTAFHAGKKGIASMVAARAADRKDGGVMRLGADDRVEAFEEKRALPGAAWINAGVLALSRDALKLLPQGRAFSLETEIFPQLLTRGFFAFKTDKPLYDIGTPERLEAFRRDLASGKITGGS